MNLVDVLLLAIVLLGLLGGWRYGFLAGALQLLVLAATVAMAVYGYADLARWLERNGLLDGVWARPAALLGILLLGRLVLGALAHVLLRGIPARVHGHVANRLLGLLPGAANGSIYATVTAMLLLALPLDDAITRHAQQSRLASMVAGPAEWVEAQLSPIFDPAVSRSLGRLTVQPESSERLTLPFSVRDARPRPDLEAAMLDLMNGERAQAGLRPLQPDPEATEVARMHARDMFARSYFSHISPEGETPFDRMRRARVRFVAAGENLALARTLAMAHRGLMDSPGHRANILRPAFGRVGVGIVDGGRHGLMVTQNFRN